MNFFDDLSDEELFELWRKGNEKAGSQLVRKYYNRVYAFLLTMTTDVHVASDLTQETIAAFLCYDKKIRKVLPCIFAIARNKFTDYCRKKKRERRRREIYFDKLDNNDKLNDSIDKITEETAMYLDKLPDNNKMRTCFIFRHGYDWTIAKIAKKFYLSENKVRYRLEQADKIFRKFFDTLE